MFSARQLHPAHRLACGLLLIVAVQALPAFALVAAIIGLALCGAGIRQHWGRLLRRSRWLLLSLLLVLAWSVAGEPLWIDPSFPSPTVEGLHDGALQALRLALALGMVATLLATTPDAEMMVGCRVLLAPLTRLGVDVDRAVVRLSLVLHYAAESPRQGWRGLLEPAAPSGPERLVLSVPSVALRDWLVLAVVLVASLAVCLR